MEAADFFADVRGHVTFLSPNKKVTKEIGLRGGARVSVAEMT